MAMLKQKIQFSFSNSLSINGFGVQASALASYFTAGILPFPFLPLLVPFLALVLSTDWVATVWCRG